MLDLNDFDIAQYAGNTAIDELYKAYRIYIEPVSKALANNNIHVVSYDFKENHDIDILSSNLTVRDIDVDSSDPINALHWSNYLTALREAEAKYCINAAIFFQIKMESVINDVIEENLSELSFYRKWNQFLKSHNATQEELDHFNRYCDNIYRKMRNTTIHAKQRFGIINAELFRFPYVYKYIKFGWYSFVFLLNKTNGLNMNSEDNWLQICQSIHRIPANISAEDFCDMSILSEKMSKKHYDYINQNL
jgi:hypothetical protein